MKFYVCVCVCVCVRARVRKAPDAPLCWSHKKCEGNINRRLKEAGHQDSRWSNLFRTVSEDGVSYYKGTEASRSITTMVVNGRNVYE
jgi:hypothetical protein